MYRIFAIKDEAETLVGEYDTFEEALDWFDSDEHETFFDLGYILAIAQNVHWEGDFKLN